MNSAFIDKIFKILIKKNYSLKKPLIIYHSTNDKIKSTNINLRLDFELGENSCLRLIDFFLTIQTKILSSAKKTIPKPDKNYKCPGCGKSEVEILSYFGSLQGKSKGSKNLKNSCIGLGLFSKFSN